MPGKKKHERNFQPLASLTFRMRRRPHRSAGYSQTCWTTKNRSRTSVVRMPRRGGSIGTVWVPANYDSEVGRALETPIWLAKHTSKNEGVMMVLFVFLDETSKCSWTKELYPTMNGLPSHELQTSC